jgi:hypothetical protein
MAFAQALHHCPINQRKYGLPPSQRITSRISCPPRIPIAVIGMQARPIKLHQALTVRLHPFNQPGIGSWINSLVL